MKEKNTKEEGFSVMQRVESLTNALRGVFVFLKSEHNAWIHCAVFIAVTCAGWYFGITKIEWMALVFAGGGVLAAEAFNTAIEIDMNLTSPEYHPSARDTKDVAAGGVLISAITAMVIGMLIFTPYFVALIGQWK